MMFDSIVKQIFGTVEVSNSISLDPTLIDPFGRLVTSQPQKLGSFDHRIDKQPNYWDEVAVTGATGVHSANTVSVNLNTTTANGSSIIRQTYRQFEYRRGNSQLILLSAVLGSPVNNNTKLLGYGDERNGCFFRVTGSGLSVVRRSGVSGSVVDEVISQADFNQDKLDGTGASGVTLDLTKQNLYFINFSWLGTNVIRYGVVVDGKIIVCHQINNANVLNVPWSQSAQLPIRVQNTNTGATSFTSTLVLTCGAVFSVGSASSESRVRVLTSDVNAININTTLSVVAGIRLKPGLRNVALQAIEYDFLAVTGNSFAYYEVRLRPTLTGATWANQSDLTDSLTNVPTSTGGILLEAGHFNTATAGRLPSVRAVRSDLFLGYSIDNTPDSLVILMRTNTGTGSIFYNAYFKEVY